MVPGGAGGWGWPSSPSGADRALPVNASEQALNRLQALPPLWRHTYGFALIARAEPGEADRLRAQWQGYIHGNALPPEALSGWHQGMEGLQEMARRLNTLDERKGKYLTGSELKSMVFTITQHFSRAVPVEERLYQLSHAGDNAPLAAQQLQLDIYLDQLLNRYMLIQQQINEGA
nr:VasL domain-containing protein [Shimwellia pseudoproteus]